MGNTVYLVTGANKGIGRSIVAQLLQRPQTTVVATVRRPADPTSASLRDLPAAAGSRLVLVRLADPADFDGLADTLARDDGGGIAALDVVIANAGGSAGLTKRLLETTPEDLLADFATNAVGALRLFRATLPLLQKKAKAPAASEAASATEDSQAAPKFILISTTMGSIGTLETRNYPVGAAYGVSKAAANFFFKKASVELRDEGVVIGLLHPGWVQTSLGQGLADFFGVAAPPLTSEESARTSLQQIDGWTLATSGRFLSNTGEVIPW